jgi:site-specific DNA-cytosine methylase
MTQQYKMIGNAVPPKFSEYILKTILRLYWFIFKYF